MIFIKKFQSMFDAAEFADLIKGQIVTYYEQNKDKTRSIKYIWVLYQTSPLQYKKSKSK